LWKKEANSVPRAQTLSPNHQHKLQADSTDPAASARAASLRYVTDTMPGIWRKRAGRGFRYIGVDGRPIWGQNELDRIKALAIPPAWTDVWICPTPRGHIQATGRDAKGRKQYRYHPRWQEVRNETKYHRMIVFGEMLPVIRKRTAEDLARPGLSREKVLATVVQLLDTTLIRVGNEEYAQQNQSFGLTTMREEHVDVTGATLRFQFRGKSGKEHTVEVRDRRLARIVRRCQELPGYELFKYRDTDGVNHTIESADVNEYLQQITGEDFTAKDFRTWSGTVIAAHTLGQFGEFESETQAKKNVVQAIKSVATLLGNTPAICRKSYVYPAVIEAYLNRLLPCRKQEQDEVTMPAPIEGLRPEEAEVLALLHRLDSTQKGAQGVAS
jgi:DNA topoisomerase-1